MTEGLSAAVASMPVRKPREERDAQEPSMFALLAAGTYNRGARQPAPASRGKVPAIPDRSASWTAKRTQDAMDAFGDDIALWEIGNELNGSWAGSSPSQINAKARAAYDVVRAAGGRTAVTFNYWSSHDCYDQPWEATLPYARQAAASVPDVDRVFLSVDETACSPAQHPSAEELASALNGLGEIYPDACLGIGEIGAQGVDDGLASDPSMPEKERLATYYYGLHDDIAAQVGPRYVGGYFWWYFYEGAVDAPEGSSLWPTLDALLNDL